MSDYFKASGKKTQLPPVPKGKWELTQRPGGWIIAESFQVVNGVKTSQWRKKIMLAVAGKHLGAHFGDSTWLGELVQEGFTSSGSKSQGQGSESDWVAQFPGKIRKVLVKNNQEVREGEVLVLIEAMKMEFAIRAPSAGKVLRMRVSEGEQITPGVKFLDWETLKNES